ncbi:hypothetical protein [Rhizobium leguminosarum]|uniref:hypothetical protein n=1 Tax=Rhizobium leguminosarum TaxID=384 RepID=UPI0015F7D7DA|nr:hypothetical protein [Rhizobium leguminosarum]MBA9030937.1 DNA end-binding protein Ku [Rhizobium leguminosarum]
MVTYPIRQSLLKIIAEKKKALTPRRKSQGTTGGTKVPSSNVINIMDALRKSMEAELKGRQQKSS